MKRLAWLMPRLIVNPSTEDAWEIPISEGVHSLGRDASNQLVIDHPSVSGNHCEFEVTHRSITLRDLDSIRGTFLEEVPVHTAVAVSMGQLIRVGEVQLTLDHDAGPAAAGTALEFPCPISAHARCKYHPKSVAKFRCENCALDFCGACVSSRNTAARFCKRCGSQCAPLEPAEPDHVASTPSFFAALRGVFTYPLNLEGIVMMIVGGGAFLLMDFAAQVSSVASFRLSLVALILLYGYIFAYMQTVIRDATEGENQPPRWPDFSGGFWDDFVLPYLKFLGIGAFSFAPAIAAAALAASGQSLAAWAIIPAMILGCLYFPMALLAVSMFDSLGAMNPLVILPSIIRVFKEYAAACFMLGLALAFHRLVAEFLPMILPVFILPQFVAAVLGMYLLTITMRLLGLLYWTKREELGWFRF